MSKKLHWEFKFAILSFLSVFLRSVKHMLHIFYHKKQRKNVCLMNSSLNVVHGHCHKVLQSSTNRTIIRPAVQKYIGEVKWGSILTMGKPRANFWPKWIYLECVSVYLPLADWFFYVCVCNILSIINDKYLLSTDNYNQYPASIIIHIHYDMMQY